MSDPERERTFLDDYYELRRTTDPEKLRALDEVIHREFLRLSLEDMKRRLDTLNLEELNKLLELTRPIRTLLWPPR